jgi:hypothetical protein
LKIQFDTLFEVEIYHNYYKSGIGEDLTIEPTVLCQRQLSNYGLFFKKTLKGFVVLYEYTTDIAGHPHPLRPIEDALKFSFLLKSTNPYLINYSKLPIDSQADQIYYLHNLNKNPINERLLLTSKQNLSADEQILLKPKFFQYSGSSQNTLADIEIVNELNQTVVKRSIPVNEEMFDYPVDLRGHWPGKFTLKADGTERLVFYANDELISNNVLAVVDLFHNESVSGPYQFIDANHDAKEKIIYQIHIERRETYWKYNVVLKYQSDIEPEGLSIIRCIRKEGNEEESSNESPECTEKIKFKRINGDLTSNGIPIVSFISPNQLALQQEPVKNIQLVVKKNTGNNSSDDAFIEHLPNPSLRSIVPIKSDNESGVSEIFVYI